MRDLSKVKCDDCDWHGPLDSALSAPNPFSSGDTITGCPECRTPCSLSYVCEHDGCWELISIGTTTPEGYRHFCSKHGQPYLQSNG